MVDQLGVIINLKIEEINALKELVATKEIMAEHIAMLYLNEQQIREIENKNFKIQLLMDKVFMIIQSGVIIALAFAI